ncbi:N-acetylmuramic acid 6-phosphate etherase [Alteribacillus sp. HJP-4]|uniref:N-acetylmuramic acid 6-phosphate etherase n=1 Tax=Alteribacillus sp. HJP-4 TaxID=2775394 RepID=UPI0035CCEF51
MNVDISQLVTEKRNPRTKNLDRLTTKEALILINKEDQITAAAVERELSVISEVIEQIYQRMKNESGRLIYSGAGTSGRIGVLDASECPPTFRIDPSRVIGISAGGEKSFFRSLESAEDEEEAGKKDLSNINITPHDTVIGITASGRTPYPIGALKYAQEAGALTVSLSSNPDSLISKTAEYSIEVLTGPEILTGSTRLKAATAHKMVLNMISTLVMVRLGKVYENLMVDLQASNDKLRDRARRIVVEATGAPVKEASEALAEADFEVKPAIIMLLTGCTYKEASQRLKHSGGDIRQSL